MSNTRISKQMLETIGEKTYEAEPMKDFLLELVKWETTAQGMYHFKDKYRAMIKEYSRRMGDKDED